MTETTDDLRIQKTNELISPEQLIADISVSEKAAETVANARRAIHRILAGEDDRMLAIVGLEQGMEFLSGADLSSKPYAGPLSITPCESPLKKQAREDDPQGELF